MPSLSYIIGRCLETFKGSTIGQTILALLLILGICSYTISYSKAIVDTRDLVIRPRYLLLPISPPLKGLRLVAFTSPRVASL